MAASAAKGSCLSPESHSRCQQLDKNQLSQDAVNIVTKDKQKEEEKKRLNWLFLIISLVIFLWHKPRMDGGKFI